MTTSGFFERTSEVSPNRLSHRSWRGLMGGGGGGGEWAGETLYIYLSQLRHQLLVGCVT